MPRVAQLSAYPKKSAVIAYSSYANKDVAGFGSVTVSGPVPVSHGILYKVEITKISLAALAVKNHRAHREHREKGKDDMFELGDPAMIDYTNRPHDELTRTIIGAAIEVPRALGPGLLESSYEACLIYELQQRGLKVEW